MQVKETPSEHFYVVMQDHGPGDGGWGTAALALPGLPVGPIVYGGSNEQTIEGLKDTCATLARLTQKPTLLAKFTQREDVLMIEGGGERIEI
jgi:hypothetical protein